MTKVQEAQGNSGLSNISPRLHNYSNDLKLLEKMGKEILDSLYCFSKELTEGPRTMLMLSAKIINTNLHCTVKTWPYSWSSCVNADMILNK